MTNIPLENSNDVSKNLYNTLNNINDQEERNIEFNKQFEFDKTKNRQTNDQIDEQIDYQKIEETNEEKNHPFYKKQIGEVVVTAVTIWFDILKDIMTFDYMTKPFKLLLINFFMIFTKKNRLFYIGLCFVLFGIVFYVLHEIFNSFTDSYSDNRSDFYKYDKKQIKNYIHKVVNDIIKK